MENVFDVLSLRGFVEQTTDDKAVHDLLQRPITCYIGFDPTSHSFHVGSLIPIMVLAHMQRHGHRVIALVGGGTALVGDPSGKTEMRQMLTREQVNENAEALKKQLARFVGFQNGQALLLNNADWLTRIEYIPFLRDIGRHFSVNRMLTSESCRRRLETGLSFIEFNYSLLQAYDYLHLCRTEDCLLQMGGSDQWGNIVAGIELVRRVEQRTAYGITFPLITCSKGNKMGKTEKGAVWLDPELTTPYEYYQFWINTSDADVTRFLSFFTFLPLAEIRKLPNLMGSDFNAAKTVLAFEATKLVHGHSEAENALMASYGLFGTRVIDPEVIPSSTIPRHVAGGELKSIPTSFIDPDRLHKGIPAFKLFSEVSACASRGAARRLLQQGGGYVNERRLDGIDSMITDKDLKKGEILLRAGKKRYHRIVVNTISNSRQKK
ncbi:MAG: tyrosine--tRNA ligase [Desulfobacterales bacterium C00003060]|nr:MAG: tyrosine--tRNA ligase [Desulfobacterales bacterium S3730MH5]OEU79413.1 MAG: tyrosine--tRNA ligase [Desulfobacterales bacterium C00003060]OEU82390.1 MAG: tyrosine--tRNA ligase [Desulfobacterales bacterium S5133MH4]